VVADFLLAGKRSLAADAGDSLTVVVYAIPSRGITMPATHISIIIEVSS
jgi:hypothetical protein